MEEIENKKEFPEEDEVLFGTVDRITGTSVFVKLDDYNKEGVVSFSEIAPGRIRNIRDYVRIGQKIVVKVLRVNKEKEHIDLSLRRVTAKEKKEIIEENKREKEFEAILNLVIKNKSKTSSIINELKRKIKFKEFFSKFISEPKEIENLLKNTGLNEEELKNIIEIMSEKIKEKKVVVKSKFSLNCDASDGIERIKTLLLDLEKTGAKISYLGAPNYLISLESKDYKEANKKLKELLDTLTLKAKEFSCKLEIFKEK
ncbi:MAG: S1 RNA-binding domain-containing protein [Candidatus Pacearchaeota archaeon]